MNYKKLGNTDIDVSTICLGTMTWGEQNTQEEAFQQMDYALDQGVNFWDTAELYSVPPKAETYGHTEIIIGNWFKQNKKRDKVILASKVAGPMRAYLRGGGNNYGIEKLTQAINDSLKRLQTDYIDLYQLHWPERNTNMFGRLGYEHKDENEWNKFEDVLGNLQKFIKEGKIREIGLSNETPWGVSKFLELSKEKGLPRMMSVQNPYSLVNRTYEVGLAEMSIRQQAGLLAYSPLGFGMLSGKYLNGQMPEGSRLKLFGNHFPRYQGTRTQKAVEEYYKVAQKHGLSLAQMSLAFVNAQPFVTSNIIGATSMDQLKENISSINIKLSNEIINEINQVNELIPNPGP